MRGLVLLASLLAAFLAVLVPTTLGPVAGPLQYGQLLPTRDATGGGTLAVPLVSQYQGLATDNVNCGPAAVAALLGYADPTLPVTPTLLLRIRGAAGQPTGDTTLHQLARALAAEGIPSTPLVASDGQDDPVLAIATALRHGRPVLALVGGAALGRGERYGGHFVVVTGLDLATETVRVIDPDTQPPRNPAWHPGGAQTWSTNLLRQALDDAPASPGALPALAIDTTRGPVLPRWQWALAAGLLLLLGLALPRSSGRVPSRGVVLGAP